MNLAWPHTVEDIVEVNQVVELFNNKIVTMSRPIKVSKCNNDMHYGLVEKTAGEQQLRLKGLNQGTVY